MTVETLHTLRLDRVIRAERQAVWDAWTKPEHVRRWSCPVPGGVEGFESDFRVGGSYTLAMRVDGDPHTAFGRYVEIDEPVRLVYTWDWQESESAVGETRVTVEFEDLGDATRVVLVHELFPDAAARDAHDEGWSACLVNFESLFA